jgi:hypothetical protein
MYGRARDVLQHIQVSRSYVQGVVVDVTMFRNTCLREENVGEDCIYLAQDNDQRQTCERGNEHPLPIKGEGFPEQLNGY